MKYNLPDVRGRYTENADIPNWFRVGGAAEISFKPADMDDLVHFLKNKPDCQITILGVGSNVIIREGGVEGVVIKLGREFAKMEYNANIIEAGAAALDGNVALFAAECCLTELEFLSGVPGLIGGAVAMNAGAYQKEMKDVLVAAEMVDLNGNLYKFSNQELDFSYRKCGKLSERQYIVTKVWLKGKPGAKKEIYERITEIRKQREETQPIRSMTGGSTFKNPDGHKAWELIDKAGCRGLKIGGGQVSEKHCNFFINTGNATATDLEELIQKVQQRGAHEFRNYA